MICEAVGLVVAVGWAVVRGTEEAVRIWVERATRPPGTGRRRRR